MGYDKAGLKGRRSLKRVSESTDIYTKLLIQLYTYLARRTESPVIATILKRLKQSRLIRRPMSYSRIGMFMRLKNRIAERKIAVIVGTVTDDTRDMEPASGVRICALKFTQSARERILARGGECITFDELARIDPKGENVVLFRGNRNTETRKHFGRPGKPGSHVKPYVAKHNGKKANENKPGISRSTR